jgi:uncharacterized membrane protein
MQFIHGWIEAAAQGIEGLAVTLMVCFIVFGTARWLLHSAVGRAGTYENYRLVLGKSLLIGLELLVAADIIRTIALDSTLMSLALLGGLVVVRTFLGWTVTLEVEGRWPWQQTIRSGQMTEGET